MTYDDAVRALEADGLTTSDAQGVVDAEALVVLSRIIDMESLLGYNVSRAAMTLIEPDYLVDRALELARARQ